MAEYTQEKLNGARAQNRLLRAELLGWKPRVEAAEKALREAREWIQGVDHVEDCAAFDRTSSRECDCGRTAILKRTRSQ
jgi:hypothetical protein